MPAQEGEASNRVELPIARRPTHRVASAGRATARGALQIANAAVEVQPERNSDQARTAGAGSTQLSDRITTNMARDVAEKTAGPFNLD